MVANWGLFALFLCNYWDLDLEQFCVLYLKWFKFILQWIYHLNAACMTFYPRHTFIIVVFVLCVAFDLLVDYLLIWRLLLAAALSGFSFLCALGWWFRFGLGPVASVAETLKQVSIIKVLPPKKCSRIVKRGCCVVLSGQIHGNIETLFTIAATLNATLYYGIE